jgi:hypothetical protein
VLFESSSLLSNDEEVLNIKLYLYEMLKVYTKLQQEVDVSSLQNHLSYWMVISALVETQTLEDLDLEYLEYHGSDVPENYFLFEESIKLLSKYFRKLSDWHNAAIY